MSQPLVSIIVPMYNVENYLSRCLNSILGQTCSDFEVLLINDGSTDNTPAIAEAFCAKDPRIHLIHKANGGLASARNAGLDAAKGTYFCFVDSDDTIDSDLLQTCLEVLEGQHCDCCCFGMYKEPEGEGSTEEIRFKPRSVTIGSEDERMHFLLHELLNYRMGWEACSRIFRGDIIRRHHLRFVSEREVFAEDLLFSFTYFLYADSCVCVDRCLYHYLQRSTSLMGESRRRNVLPQVYRLAGEGFRAAERAGLSAICRDYAAIYLHLLEWQARPYIAANGIDWLRREFSALPLNPFDVDFVRLTRRYGAESGFVSVCLALSDADHAETALSYIDSLLEQTMQKLEILVLHHRRSLPAHPDPRVRYVALDSIDAPHIAAAAFLESHGEYLYFADLRSHLPVSFLERCSDALKYNACGTLVFRAQDSHFFDIHSAQQRQLLRETLHRHKPVPAQAMVRSDLADRAFLSSPGTLPEHTEEIILSDHVLFLQEDFLQ